MLSQQEIARYSKQIILPEFRTEGQQKLRAAKVLVIGAGGLGCPILQYLTAAGVGTIGVADGDQVAISNLQRQVLYTEDEVGQLKAEVAAGKLEKQNPHVHFQIHPCFIDTSNALHILAEYDLIIDGSDNFATRYLVNDACVILGKPFVSGAIYKYEGQVSVFNYQGGPTYRCLFPEPPGENESPNCADIGVIATLPGIIGSIQASEAIKIITGLGDVLSGRLLVMDTLSMNTYTFNFSLNEANKNISTLTNIPQYCNAAPQLISYTRLQEMISLNPALQLIDVREVSEHTSRNIGGTNIPLSGLSNSSHLDPTATTILYCASGVRSQKAAALLAGQGFTDVYSLENGINGLLAL